MESGAETNIEIEALKQNNIEYEQKYHASLSQNPHVDSNTLRYAIDNGKIGGDTLMLVRYLAEWGKCDIHGKNRDGNTPLTYALVKYRFDVADYLLSRDDFLPSDIIPKPGNLPPDTYADYRAKAVSRVNELIDRKGIEYARVIAADIEKMLKKENPRPTKEDVEALGRVTKKISSTDWVADAQVTSRDFEMPDM